MTIPCRLSIACSTAILGFAVTACHPIAQAAATPVTPAASYSGPAQELVGLANLSRATKYSPAPAPLQWSDALALVAEDVAAGADLKASLLSRGWPDGAQVVGRTVTSTTEDYTAQSVAATYSWQFRIHPCWMEYFIPCHPNGSGSFTNPTVYAGVFLAAHTITIVSSDGPDGSNGYPLPVWKESLATIVHPPPVDTSPDESSYSGETTTPTTPATVDADSGDDPPVPPTVVTIKLRRLHGHKVQAAVTSNKALAGRVGELRVRWTDRQHRTVTSTYPVFAQRASRATSITVTKTAPKYRDKFKGFVRVSRHRFHAVTAKVTLTMAVAYRRPVKKATQVFRLLP